MNPSISISRDIPAPADQIFAILTTPAAHPDVDGSGMLRAPVDDVVVTKVGDIFAMNMVREGRPYIMENHVRELERGRRIVWEPIIRPSDPNETGESAHYLWGWQLDPLNEDSTRVTEFFDCSQSPAWLKDATSEGEGWRSSIEESLANLEHMVAKP